MATDQNPLLDLLQRGNWNWIAAYTVLLILVWETAKNLAPKVAAALFRRIGERLRSGRKRAADERSVRQYTLRTAEANWIAALPRIAPNPFQPRLDTFYQPLRLHYEGPDRSYRDTSVTKVLSEARSFAVTGPPGCGKSTLISMIAAAYAHDTVADTFQVKDSRLPLLAPMRQFPANLKPLPETLAEILQNANCGVEAGFIRAQLEAGRCIVLFDGLDESGTLARRADVVKWLQSAIVSYEGNRFIVSCRTNEWDAMPVPGLGAAHVLPLNASHCQALAERWTHALTERPGGEPQSAAPSGTLQRLIAEQPYSPLGSFAGNPLMLTILILLALKRVDVPKKRSQVYLVFLRMLLGQWDRTKGMGFWTSDADVERRIKLFQRLAGFAAITDMGGRSADLTTPGLPAILTNGMDGTAADCIAAIVEWGERSSLLSCDSPGKAAFTSRALFDFLLAKDLVERGQDGTALEAAGDQLWFEVVLNALELAGDLRQAMQALRQGAREGGTRLLLFGYAIAESRSRGTETDGDLELFSRFVSEAINDGQPPAALCKLAWQLQGDAWRERLEQELSGTGGSVGSKAAARFLAAVDSPETIGVLANSARTGPAELRSEIAGALESAQSSEAIDLLWFLGRQLLFPSVIDQLAKRGEAAVATGVQILRSKTASVDEKRFAISVLAQTNDATALEALLRYGRECEPQLHFVVVGALKHSYFKRFGEERPVAAIEEAMDGRGFYLKRGKRALDVCVSSAALVSALPLMAAIALAIKLSSGDPVLFRQT